MADLESLRLDNGSGSELLFYIELDGPGNRCRWCSTNLSLLRVDLMDDSCNVDLHAFCGVEAGLTFAVDLQLTAY